MHQRTGLNSNQSQHPRARSDYDEETAYDSYINSEPFRPGGLSRRELDGALSVIYQINPLGGGSENRPLAA